MKRHFIQIIITAAFFFSAFACSELEDIVNEQILQKDGEKQAKEPKLYPAEGSYSENVILAIQNPNKYGQIRYTTDGSDPNCDATSEDGSFCPYHNPVKISSTTTIRAIICNDSGNDSPILTGKYEIARKYSLVAEPAVTKTEQLSYLYKSNTGMSCLPEATISDYPDYTGSDPASGNTSDSASDGSTPSSVSVDSDSVFGSPVEIPGAFKGNVYLLPANTNRLPDFTTMTPVGSIWIKSVNITRRSFTAGFPGISTQNEWFAIDYHGTFYIKNPGNYYFELSSDDGSKLLIDGNLIINNDGLHASNTMQGSVYLQSGAHTINLQYFQGPRYEIELVLKYTPTPVTGSYGPSYQVFDIITLGPKQ